RSSQATQAKAPAQTEGCVSCHKGTEDPHPDGQVPSCVACHGGDPAATTKEKAHPKPKYPQSWPTSGNPEESYILLNRESKEWIHFVNPSDLRVAEISCGKCHEDLIKSVKKYTMTTSYQVYSTALYNNGTLPWKNAVLGESYTDSGKPQAMRTIPPPTEEETRTKGILPIIFTFPRFEVGQPGDIFRPFERGGGPKSELGNPDRQDIPGQPDVTLSNRGYGTQAAVDPVIIGAHKVRLNDPVMSFLGTNNAPGDYRTSGCGSCHVIYANDRSTFNSGPWAKYGNTGHSFSDDPTIPKNEAGHPIQHKFTRSIPSSQCITCHVHNGNGFLNTYLGYMWWDEETDGEFLYPQKQHNPTQKEIDKAGRFNPEEAAARGLWKDPKFLETVSDLNPQMHKMQVSDYHGHGWMFRRVYKQDRKGNYLTADDQKIDFNDPDLFKKAVHLQDIHLEKGMHCVDCHFNQDAHGNDKIYGDRRAAIEIACEDCHGSLTKKITKLADLKTSGFGAPDGGNKINERTPFGQTRFVLRNGKLFQRSMVEQGKEWEVIQVQDTVTPGNEHYNEKSAAAKTMMKDGATWGNASADPNQLAHSEAKVSCVACHSSWVTNCFGCHLAASVNTKKPLLHMEGDADETQVYASYNPQVLRTDGYMLGIDGTVQGHKVMPVRSSSVVSFSVRNNTRGWIINHVPTISAAGYNGNAFNTHPPHTVRAKETKQCTDCHVSANNDNNSWMAGVTMLGTNQVNFMGKYIYMAEGKGGLSATRVTEDDQPEAVFGSHLHKIAYPDDYKEFVANKGLLSESHSHRTYESNQVQMYSEYLLSAAGKHGFIVYDIANVANKDFSQRIVTAPFSPLGQGLSVKTKNATGVAVGSPIPLDPKRVQLPVNEEQPVAKL